jgi:hypothetical protein
MTIRAELHDGRALEFPDGTDQAVIQRVVKEQLSGQPAKPYTIGGEIMGAVDRLKSDFGTAYGNLGAATGGRGNPGAKLGTPEASRLEAADRIGTDLVNVATSPFVGALNKFINKPLSRATGLSEDDIKAVEMAGSMALGNRMSSASQLPPKAPAAPKPNPLAPKLQAFDQAGVRPSLAAMSGPGAASAAKMVAENPIAGVRVRKALQGSIDDTAAAASRQATGYGTPSSRGAVGEGVQKGVQDFNARFSDRAGSLYDKAFSDIEAGQQAALQRAQSVASLRSGRGAASVAPEAVIAPDATRAVVAQIQGRGQSPALKELFTSPQSQALERAVNDPASLSFQDLRDARTWVREAKRNEQLRGSIGDGNLNSIESALTQDITANAERLAGPQAARKLRQADQFYRLGSQRIEGALQNFVGKSSAPKAGENTYDLIIRAATDKGGSDISRLTALKKSLKPDEWGDVGATVIQNLGKPTAGQADLGDFSVNQFVTRYNELSPFGRVLLFGSGEQRAALENLVKVAGMQKGVERAANASKSAVAGQSLATVAGLANPGTTAPTAAFLGGLGVTGEMMTNPAVVRWLARTTEAKAKSPAVYQETLKQLEGAARKNTALLPLYQQALLLEAPKATISASAQEEPSNTRE